MILKFSNLRDYEEVSFGLFFVVENGVNGQNGFNPQIFLILIIGDFVGFSFTLFFFHYYLSSLFLIGPLMLFVIIF